MKEFEQSRLQDIYIYLKSKGFDVYFPAQHQGECVSPYTVIKESGSTQFRQYSSTVQYFDLLCYVPRDQYSTLQTYLQQVKDAMKGLVPMIKPAYYETAPFYDDSVKGHMISTQYMNYRTI